MADRAIAVARALPGSFVNHYGAGDADCHLLDALDLDRVRLKKRNGY
ncbi:hypothetical protein [Roseovarius sp. ZX-A-9]|nr:hypothetical protein [Roseovarius sp. ZX-A-9]